MSALVSVSKFSCGLLMVTKLKNSLATNPTEKRKTLADVVRTLRNAGGKVFDSSLYMTTFVVVIALGVWFYR